MNINKKEILNKLNEFIIDEKGCPVTLDSNFNDAELDSLGTFLVLVSLDNEYKIFNDTDKKEVNIQKFINLTIRQLVSICILSITKISTEQNV